MKFKAELMKKTYKINIKVIKNGTKQTGIN